MVSPTIPLYARSDVPDTNVLVSASRSRQGASYRLLSLVGLGEFEICLSVPLILEYEAVLLKHLDELTIARRDIAKLLDYMVSVAHHQEVFFLWRPPLAPNDWPSSGLDCARRGGVVSWLIGELADELDATTQLVTLLSH